MRRASRPELRSSPSMRCQRRLFARARPQNLIPTLQRGPGSTCQMQSHHKGPALGVGRGRPSSGMPPSWSGSSLTALTPAPAPTRASALSSPNWSDPPPVGHGFHLEPAGRRSSSLEVSEALKVRDDFLFLFGRVAAGSSEPRSTGRTISGIVSPNSPIGWPSRPAGSGPPRSRSSVGATSCASAVSSEVAATPRPAARITPSSWCVPNGPGWLFPEVPMRKRPRHHDAG